MSEVRAQIGAPRTDLAISQGCTCHVLERDDCVVHGEVDAFVVERIFYGQRLTRLSTRTHTKQPIKNEIKFFRDLYPAVGLYGERSELVATTLLKKEMDSVFRRLTLEELEEVRDIQDALNLAFCSTRRV